MTVEPWLQGLLHQSAIGLFAAYEAPISFRESHTGRPFEIAVVIGFQSRELNGSLVVGMDTHAVEVAMPPCLDNWSEWAGELANQLMGRVVNHLSDFGICAQMATPILLDGDQLAADGLVWGDLRLELDGSPVGVCLRCTSAPNFEPTLIHVDRPHEGDLLFF
jgi:hypothetical protein